MDPFIPGLSAAAATRRPIGHLNAELAGVSVAISWR
jgi:hypothetical protein